MQVLEMRAKRGRKGGREEGKGGGREGEREGGREGGKEKERERHLGGKGYESKLTYYETSQGRDVHNSE